MRELKSSRATPPRSQPGQRALHRLRHHSSGEPWRTLERASNGVQAGDLVIVRAGTYAGFDLRTSGTQTNPIEFRAEAGVTVNVRNPVTPDGIIHDVGGEGRVTFGAPTRVAFAPRRTTLWIADASLDRLVALRVGRPAPPPLLRPLPARTPPAMQKRAAG